MVDYSKNRKRREYADTLRALEIWFAVINEIEENHFEENDFEKSKDEILAELYEIKIPLLARFQKVEEVEEKLFEIIGENFFLFIPPESKIYKKIKVGVAK